jgi:hypothetical protein
VDAGAGDVVGVSVGTLAEHKDWLYSVGATRIHDCTCPFGVRSLGRGHGQGWVRLRDEPGCPEHDDKEATHGSNRPG